jgi:predicted transcriptional regulator
MTKKLLEIAAEIVQAQTSVSQMSADQIELALTKTFSTLQRMQRAEEGGVPLESIKPSDESAAEGKAPEKIDPKESIQEDRVVCLECGTKMKQLTGKHLSSHALSMREYKQKWGFPLKQSLSARALSKARSKAAKKRGLPENLVRYQEERKNRKRMESAIASDQPSAVAAGEEKKESKTRLRKPGRKKSE